MSAAPDIAPALGARVLGRDGHLVSAAPLEGQRAIGLTVQGPIAIGGQLVRLELADAAFLRDQLSTALLLASWHS